MSELLTPDEVADMLKVSKRWVYRASQDGRLPSSKVGKFLRFERDAVIEWLKKDEEVGQS